jgi:lipopolysaccharide biosynthesis glycosyltransferase
MKSGRQSGVCSAPRGGGALRILLCADPSYFKHMALAAGALAESNRIIYLDSDVVVVAELRPFWDTVPGPQPLAAAPDHFGQRRREALGIPDRYTYVNAGVLLLDLASWRRQDLSRRLFDYIERHGQAIREACREPAVIHFCGPEKPWLFRSRTARKNDYFRYLEKTAWRDTQPPLATTMHRIEYRADRLLSRAGIDDLQVLYKIGRAPAKLGIVAAALVHRLRAGTSALVGKAASDWETDR